MHRNHPSLAIAYTWLPDAEDAEEIEAETLVSWSRPRRIYREIFDTSGTPFPPNEWTRSLTAPEAMDSSWRGNSYNNGSYTYGLVSWSAKVYGRYVGLLQIRGWLDDQDPATDEAEFAEDYEVADASTETGDLPVRTIDLTAETPAAAFSHWTVRFVPSHLRTLAEV